MTRRDYCDDCSELVEDDAPTCYTCNKSFCFECLDNQDDNKLIPQIMLENYYYICECDISNKCKKLKTHLNLIDKIKEIQLLHNENCGDYLRYNILINNYDKVIMVWDNVIMCIILYKIVLFCFIIFSHTIHFCCINI